MKKKITVLALILCAALTTVVLLAPPEADARPNFILHRTWLDASGNVVGTKTVSCWSSGDLQGTTSAYQVMEHTSDCGDGTTTYTCLANGSSASCSNTPFSYFL